MSGAVLRFDHVNVTVSDLDAAVAFFGVLGLEVEGRMHVEGDFLDTVIGIPGSHTEIAMLTTPDGATKLELARFVQPEALPGAPAAMANELGLRALGFEVDDIEACRRALADGGHPHELVGGIGTHEDVWRMAYVRGPDGIIVSLAQRIGD